MEAETDQIRTTGILRNPDGIEVKYFATSETGANRYAQLAFGRFGDESSYDIIRVEVSSALLDDIFTVDSNIGTVVLSSDQLVGLSPELLNYGLREVQ